ncbi:diacylglycerol/lipid kinase family protein [Vulgatibacter incomptus]|uniref:DAGKc domain-containing protein n=1 Tax=Vulgatibacter incomptus TaxID=1391653 RepID=A0A0K1PF09_9BACT|nr:diacylglycerol kinase family protein [Vulgatibacter incomptus]AKU91699.1 hypothetical protein AKJ08_2086 [Vulgatibacter incomptus]
MNPAAALSLADSKVAVLLNANAKRVSQRVHRALSHVVPEDDLFFSRCTSEARTIARTVVDRQYRTVFTGGGDGTFVSFVTEILDFLRGSALPTPRFGVLKLGTGNALAGMVGATAGQGILDDVLRARAGEVPCVKRIDLIQANGRATPFAGVGLDAAILNDYGAVKRRFGNGPLKKLASGAPGYAIAAATRTLPHNLVNRKMPEIEVVNGNGHAALLGPDGRPIREFGPGDVLFRGPAQVCAASTVPFYGFNFKMFPFAGMVPGRMQLRITNVNPMTIVTHLGSIWKGRFRHPNISDFHVEEFIVRSNEKLPLQIGGDAEGYSEEIRFGLAPKQVELVDYSMFN